MFWTCVDIPNVKNQNLQFKFLILKGLARPSFRSRPCVLLLHPTVLWVRLPELSPVNCQPANCHLFSSFKSMLKYLVSQDYWSCCFCRNALSRSWVMLKTAMTHLWPVAIDFFQSFSDSFKCVSTFWDSFLFNCFLILAFMVQPALVKTSRNLKQNLPRCCWTKACWRAWQKWPRLKNTLTSEPWLKMAEASTDQRPRIGSSEFRKVSDFNSS